VAEAISSIRGDIPRPDSKALALDLSKAEPAMEGTKRFPDLNVLGNNLGVYQPKPFEQISDAK
jgi:hypothetical protein